ncbi:MAG: hypothetical protein J6A15_00940 [Clostridia bacterium]|nr:hypothetical protein [Clostridia bacterium]
MASYYTPIQGTLDTGKTARSSDIHLIQSGIQDAISKALIDITGTGVILGESEDALKLEPTTQKIDQSNPFFDEENAGVSFYEIYLRQPIDIEKSSIETVRLQMLNNSNISVTIYGEIRDADLDLVQETNTILNPTDDNEYADIDFHFNLNHLPLGRYYFVLRPVDVSAVDLTINGDESIYDTLRPEMFLVKYDNEGNYSKAQEEIEWNSENTDGLEASYDGNEFLEARYLEELRVTDDSGNVVIADHNFDLYFEEIFSSGNTYLINNGAAIVLGEKVYPLDTHVTIDGPSTHGDRTDLVILTADGQLHVIKGTVYTGEKFYPTDNTGLKIAYITTYQYGLSDAEKEKLLNGETVDIVNKKVPSIEQNDENEMTRRRDILERIRRLEKKINYQFTNNSPTRIKYNCEVDPILANNGVDSDALVRGEGTYGMGNGTASNGDNAVVIGNTQTYSWSIIENGYNYNYTTSSVVTGSLEVHDVHMPKSKPKNIQSYMKCQIALTAPGYGKKTTNNPKGKGGVPYAKIKITIKKNSTNVATYNIKTNNNGEYALSLWNIKKLKEGTYKIYAQYNGKTAKSTMKVYADNHSFSNIKDKSHSVDVQVKTATAAQSSQTIPSGTFSGNDSFYLDRTTINTDKGVVGVQRIGDNGSYQKNKLLRDRKVFSSSDIIYKLKSDKVALTSEYPVLNFTIPSDTYIKSITPYISGFKNIDKFGILIFKNDFVFDADKNSRKVIQKKINKFDPIFTTVYDSGWKSLSDLKKQSDGYKALKQQVKFDINKDFDKGTYSLVVYGHIKSGNSEGAIKIKEYVTRDYKKEYGIATKCTGGSKLSVINMDKNNLTNRSWDVLIEQRPYKYYNSGVIISKPIDTVRNIRACTMKSNIKTPNGCSANVYVSNNGGTSWTSINSGHVKFDGDGFSFRWKIEMTTNSETTPQLIYNEAWKYAISFNLAETATYVEYEDYQRCYETPLLNANAITRTFVANDLIEHRFSEWEFARLFIEDEELKSKIDILVSYADNAYSSVGTDKSKWDSNIFFSQVFADLTLEDFSRESVDYDNYDGNVEYDEYNYRFKMESENIIHSTGGNALASPDVYYKNTITSPYKYGDIAASDDDGIPLNNIYQNFLYEFKDTTYSYVDNDGDSKNRYAGMHITDGPVWNATLKTSNPSYEPEDVIIGVSFIDTLDIDENITYVTLGIKPIIETTKRKTDTTHYRTTSITNEDGETIEVEQYVFPPNTFDIVVSPNKHGEVDDNDAFAGKSYTINKELVITKDPTTDTIISDYNEVTVNFIDDLDGFSASGIGSIGIRVKDTDSLLEGEGIGLGRIITGSYNRRPYVPYMYTGKWDRLSWQKIGNTSCQAYAMYTLGRKDAYDTQYKRVFYPITNYDKNAYKNTITFDSSGSITAKYENSSGSEIASVNLTNTNEKINLDNKLYIWSNDNTSKSVNKKFSNTEATTNIKSTIIRRGHEISTIIQPKNTNAKSTYVTNDSGNQTLFYFPKDVTGELFKIETDIPYTIYDLIDIEYYVFTTFVSGETTTNNLTNVNSYDGNTYTTHGAFSKGDIYINFYDTRDTQNAEPVERFALPAWGRIQTTSHVKNKVVHSWFKKHSAAVTIKAITISRENPRKNEVGKTSVKPEDLFLMLNNILLFNADMQAALGPQMQMRIYPNTMDNLSNTKIRKVGCIYRI